MDQTADPTQLLSDPPRELTKLARRRTWTEPRVRLWWVLGFGVVLLTLYVVGTQAATWVSERWLITNGTPVEATIIGAQSPIVENVTAGRPMPPDSDADLSFDFKGAQRVKGKLPNFIEAKRNVIVGEKITIRVDPEDPTNWTSRDEPAPLLSRQLVGIAVGLPAVIVLMLVAMLKRRKVAAIYREGHASAALVLGTGQTPVAPRSRSVRCTPAEGNDKRVFTVYLPAGAAPVAPGDVVWVLHAAGKPDPAFAVAWFGRETPTP